jgi:uncharacterized protein
MSDTVIQLFARLPVTGSVKTRLIPEIGADNATAVYRHCLRYSLSLINQSDVAQQLWLDQTGQDAIFDNFSVYTQRGSDLGARMLHAIQHGLRQYSKVILIGSDCIELNLKILQQVEQKLAHYDLVLIPARDGGYVLIAARDHIEPEIFSAINWGSDSVLKQTLLKCMQHKIRTYILNPLRDIDHASDLKHYPELAIYLN